MNGKRITSSVAKGATLLAVGGFLVAPLVTSDADTTALGQDDGQIVGEPAKEAVYAKYDGVNGESTDKAHDAWIDVLSVDWGAARPRSKSGALRRRGETTMEDLKLTMEYEKSTPKLQESCLKGEVIPKLEIDMTATYGQATESYIKYELTNVVVSSYSVSGGGESPPVVDVSLNFQSVKVTYTERDRDGAALGTTGFEHSRSSGK